MEITLVPEPLADPALPIACTQAYTISHNQMQKESITGCGILIYKSTSFVNKYDSNLSNIKVNSYLYSFSHYAAVLK